MLGWATVWRVSASRRGPGGSISAVEDLDTRILEALKCAKGVEENLDALLVFGSRARGNPRPDSDLDIAVLPAAGLTLSPWRLQGRIASALAELAPEGRVDVVLLDEAPVLLRQRVMEHGRLIACRNPAAWKALRVRTMREYGDSQWMRDRYRRAQARRLAGAG